MRHGSPGPPGARATRRLATAVAAAGLMVASLVTSPGPAAASAGGGTLVTTDRGPVRGTAVDGRRDFLGVPYAAPPVGERRWTSPVPPARWTAPRDATRPGPDCA